MLRTIPLTIFFAGSALFANPQGATIQSGIADLSLQENLLEIRPSDGAIINWKEFSIQPHEITRFVQPDAKSRVLNRVTGEAGSSLLGRLEANGQIYLINPHGVIIGKEAKIYTNGLFLTTFDIENDLFTKDEWILRGNSEAAIINHGFVQAGDGEIYCIAEEVQNLGQMEAKSIHLTAGQGIIVRPQGEKWISIRPDGDAIEAIESSINPYALAIRHEGEPQALSMVEQDGKIFLCAESSLKAETIQIQADFVNVDEGALLTSGEKEGNFVLWGETICAFNGSIATQGGLVEISSREHLFVMPGAKVNTNGGTLLLDPTNITINGVSDTNLGPFLTVPPHASPPPDPGLIYTFTTTPATILNTHLETFLATNNVLISTANGPGGGAGTITVSAPVSWSSGLGLYLTADADIDVNALITATGGGLLNLTAGGNISVGAGTNRAPSALKTVSGSITLSAGAALNLNGGGVGAYAEISSISGDINVSSVGTDVILTSGTGAGAYAQIGVGNVTGSVSISSNITFSNVGNNVTLQPPTAGAGAGAYTQIGHAPNTVSASSVNSTISFINGVIGVGNAITLTGSSSADSSAIIGHGNQFSTALESVSGQILLQSEVDLTLNGGTGSRSHAIVGFSNPATGSNVPFIVTSPLVSVQTTVAGNVVLKAGTGSNAVIGYYNPTISAGNTEVDITLIQVHTTLGEGISLTAGNQGGVSAGNAVIGTLVNLGSANSSLSLLTGQYSILGPQFGGNNGAARIINQRPGVSVPGRDVNISTNTFSMGNINLLGGISSTGGFADIYSSGTLELNYIGSLNVNNNATLQSGYAQIQAYGTIGINENIHGTSMFVTGGNPGAFALIQSLSSFLTLGSTSENGVNNIQVGNAASLAPSQVLTAAGNSIWNFGTDLTVVGGAGLFAPVGFAEIGSTNGSYEFISSSGSLTVTGGSAANNFAEIGTNNGSIVIEFDGGDVTVMGGSGSQAYAQIGRGIGTGVTDVNSTIEFKRVDGNLTVRGGTFQGAYAQVGHSPLNGATTTTVSGTITSTMTFDRFINGAIIVEGSTTVGATGATAIIGFGNELTPTLSSVTGSIDLVSVTGGIQVIAGTPAQTEAVIGFCNPNMSANPFLVNSSLLQLKSLNGPITVTANNPSNATIGYYNSTNLTSQINVTIADLDVNATINNNITLTAGNDGGTGGGVASIGTLANLLTNTAVSNINVTGSSILLQGPSGNFNGSARIVNSLPGILNPLFNINIFAQANYTMLGGTSTIPGFADVYSCNNATLEFFNNGNINNDPVLQSGYAQFVAGLSALVNQTSVGNILKLQGGSNPSAIALIMANTGQCLVGGTTPGPTQIIIGDPTSLAYSKIVAVEDLCGVSASTSIALQGGSQNAGGGDGPAVAFIQNTSGLIVVNAGTTLTLTGGTGDDTSAQIINTNNNITLLSGSDIQLIGGPGGAGMTPTGNRAFAQIGTYSGSVTFTNIGGNLYLNNPGGAGTECYAQIGIGRSSTNMVNSSISFNSISGDVVLQGGLGSCSYAQIGHSPYCFTMPCNLVPCTPTVYTVMGDVQFSNVNGNVFLNGGTVPDTSATIGHGNPLTANLISASGTISVASSGVSGVTLNPGPGLDSHATIGYFSPFAGSPSGFSVLSNGVSVTTNIGPISILAANGNNATVGYYNAATPTAVSVAISTINLTTSTNSPAPPNQIILQADNGAPTNGIASISTYAAAMGASTTSNISLLTYELDINGPPQGNNGQSLIYNNVPCLTPPCMTCTTDPFNITIMTTNINLLGGLGVAPGMSAIYSSQDMEMDFLGTFNINRNPAALTTLQTGNATVTAQRNIAVNPSNNMPGDLFVLGGATTEILSSMNSVNGNITWGDMTQIFPGVNHLTIGSANMRGPARIFTCPGTGGSINLLGSSTISLQGGAVAGAFADLNANSSLIVTTAGNIHLNSGLDTDTSALMNAASGQLLVTSQGTVTLTGSTLSPALFSATGNLFHVEATTNVNLLNNSTFRNNGTGLTFVYAGTDINLNHLGSIINFGSGPLTILAGHSLSILNSSLIQANGGVSSLVVDNNYPTPPGMGNGFINLDRSSQINSGGGSLRIFTAQRPLNTLNGLLNGYSFVPGTPFVNTATEIWGVYYPSILGGDPFTLFYKGGPGPGPGPSPAPITPSQRGTANQFLIAFGRSYEDLIFDVILSPLSYDREAYEALTRNQMALMSYEMVPDLLYFNMRRLYRNYNLKIIDTLE